MRRIFLVTGIIVGAAVIAGGGVLVGVKLVHPHAAPGHAAAIGHRAQAASSPASSPSAALPPGVKAGPSPGTYFVDCSVGQCTTSPGAGPFGTTCTVPSTDEQYCGPDVTPGTPSPPPAQSGPVSISCQMGYVNIPAGSGVDVSQKTFQLSPPTVDTADGYSLSDYEAMQLSITVQQDTSITGVTVVWYDANSNEISSGSVDIGQLITAGQTLTYLYDESTGSSPNPPAGAASCTAPYYD